MGSPTRYRPGQLYKPKAEDLNAYGDAWDRIHDLKSVPEPNHPPLAFRVKNTSGAHLARHHIAHLGASILPVTAENDRGRFSVLHEASELTSESWAQFVVVQKPIPSGDIGPAVIRGVSFAMVNVTHSWHRFADFTEGTPDRLTSCPHGSAEILVGADDVGLSPCLVFLGPRRSVTLRAKPVADRPPDSSGLFDVWRQTTSSSAPVSTGYHLTAHHRWMAGTKTLPEGTECRITFYPDSLSWEVTEAECPPA